MLAAVAAASVAQQKNLELQTCDWGWLLQEFASAYGLSSTYSLLAYLACVSR